MLAVLVWYSDYVCFLAQVEACSDDRSKSGGQKCVIGHVWLVFLRSPIGTCLGRHDDNQLISARAPTRPSTVLLPTPHIVIVPPQVPPPRGEEKSNQTLKSLRVPPPIHCLSIVSTCSLF